MTAYNTVPAILQLLSTIRPEYQEMNLIDQMNNFFKFDHNIILVNGLADIDPFINKSKREFVPQSLFLLNDVEEKNTGLESLKQIRSKNPFLIVVSEHYDIGLLTRIKEIQRLKIDIKIGLFCLHTVSYDVLQKLFQWCWSHGIINIFVAFHLYSDGSHQASSSNNLLKVFTFNPFQRFEVINVTKSESFETFFPSQNSNFHRHPIRIGQNHVMFSGLANIGHINIRLWEEVFRVLNASFTIVLDENIYKLSRGQLFENDTMDVVTILYADNEPGYIYRSVNLYPMIVEDFVVMVPEAAPYSGFAVFLLAATSNEILLYSIIAIGVTMILLSCFRFIKRKNILFFQSGADVLNLLMNDNGSIKYRDLYRVEAFIIVPLTFIGFIIVNGILSSLQSYLTRPYMQHPINTIEDIYKAKLPIVNTNPLLIHHAIQVFNNMTKRNDWKDRLHVQNGQKMEQEIRKMNKSMSFIWPHYRATILQDFQKRINVRGYRISNIRFFKYVGSYPINGHFPFTQRINEIINRIRSSGLHQKWWKETQTMIVRDEVFLNRVPVNTAIDTQSFAVPEFIVYGWILSLLVFVFEIIWKNVIKRQK